MGLLPLDMVTLVLNSPEEMVEPLPLKAEVVVVVPLAPMAMVKTEAQVLIKVAVAEEEVPVVAVPMVPTRALIMEQPEVKALLEQTVVV
ncbi:hypothetical protein D3C87_1698840 [compost metagenome]